MERLTLDDTIKALRCVASQDTGGGCYADHENFIHMDDEYKRIVCGTGEDLRDPISDKEAVGCPYYQDTYECCFEDGGLYWLKDVSVCKQRLQENGKETGGDGEMNNKPTPDITPNLAISAYHVLQQYCTGQPADCRGCRFYEHCPECFQGIPCDWSLNEEGEINEVKEGNTD